MRKIFTFFLILSIAQLAKAQVVFYENFDNIPGVVSGGAGTYAFPTGWLLRNVDGRTPYGLVSYMTQAWIRREDLGAGNNDSCAMATSWYSPAGAADDWMWTPLISTLPANCVLSWRAKAYDPSFRDGYQVRIMVSTDGPPTGGTGSLGNQVSNSTVLYTNTAEITDWVNRSVSLSAYAGQSVYIAFRNNSSDKFMLAIDDVKVAVGTPLPVKLVSFTAGKTQAGNKLQWQVASQQDIRSYKVERSTDATYFAEIGSVTANNLSSFAYEFTDVDQQNKTVYYRLKIVEDNHISYSTIVSINNNSVNNRTVLYPNPVKTSFSLQANNSDLLNTHALLTDQSGKTVKQYTISKLPFTGDMATVPAGIYFLKLQNGESIRIVKQ